MVRDTLNDLRLQNLHVYSPPLHLCGDNGVMVAWVAIEKFRRGISDKIDGNDDVLSRWPLGVINRVDYRKVPPASRYTVQKKSVHVT